MKTLNTLIVILVVGASAYFGVHLTSSLAGKKPTNIISTAKNSNSAHSVKIEKTLAELLPASESLQAQIKADPKNIALHEQLAVLVKTEYQNSIKSGAPAATTRELSFYYLESLLEILKIDQQNKNALISLADIAFEKQIFVKASEYYQAYLDLEPKDLSARARYASALTFSNKLDLAISELDQILKDQPKHFQALAYKTIALAQKSLNKEALEVAKVAMENAPSEEAKTRFGAYLKTLENQETQIFSALRAYLINNEMTSSKFVELKSDQGKLQIYFTQFPMNQMPEFAKAKFLGKIKELLLMEKGIEVRELEFVDFEDNSVMLSEKVSVRAKS